MTARTFSKSRNGLKMFKEQDWTGPYVHGRHNSDGSPESLFVEEVAVRILLDDEILFVTFYRNSLELAVSLSDLFAYSSADAQIIKGPEELESLYKAWYDDRKWGVDKWACKQRGFKPIQPKVERMKAAGVWDDEMEALVDNKY